MQTAQQLADGGDDSDLQALRHMVDYLEAHNAQIQPEGRLLSPISPPVGPANALMPAAHATFVRFRQLADMALDRSNRCVTKLLRSLGESMDAPDLDAFAAERGLDLHLLKIQRAHLVAQGADAYLATLFKQEAASIVPNLRRSSNPSQQERPPGLCYPAKISPC